MISGRPGPLSTLLGSRLRPGGDGILGGILPRRGESSGGEFDLEMRCGLEDHLSHLSTVTLLNGADTQARYLTLLVPVTAHHVHGVFFTVTNKLDFLDINLGWAKFINDLTDCVPILPSRTLLLRAFLLRPSWASSSF